MLRVSDNHRFLVHEDGTPFFYLGDTAWELFHRLTLAEAESYLADRAAKGFTVIQAVVLAELDGLHTPNANGDLPLIDDDPTRPREPYFAHVDRVVDLAESLGLHIGMLPTWGDKWNEKWGPGPEIFTPENARIYGTWLGRRYADKPIIWIVGGDRPIENERHRLIIRGMAEGLREGDGGRHLITMHTWGPHTTAEYVHDEAWLDFHTCQSGHTRNMPNWKFIQNLYALQPVRPCMDAEAGYEDAASTRAEGPRNLNNGFMDDWDVRKTLYWSLFAGSFGHTYGCNPIWQMWRAGLRPHMPARRPWYEAIHLPGAAQMQYAIALLLSRPYFDRIPDQGLILSDQDIEADHVQATRDSVGTYAMIYVPGGKDVEVDLSKLAGERLVAYWYNPRNGTSQRIGVLQNNGRMTFTPARIGPDWVLVIDDATAGYPRPGSRQPYVRR